MPVGHFPTWAGRLVLPSFPGETADSCGELLSHPARVCPLGTHELAGLGEPREHLVDAVRQHLVKVAALERLDDDGSAVDLVARSGR